MDGPEAMHLWRVGRQSGKTSLAAAASIHNCTMRADLDDMIPHSRSRAVPIISPSEDQSREFVQIAAGMIEASPVLAELADIKGDRIDFRVPRVDEHGHRWTAKTSIRAMAANARSVRGPSSALVIFEEMAHLNSTEGPANDRRLFDGLQPQTLVFGSKARILGISTPYFEEGLYYDLVAAAEGGTLPSACAVHAATWDMVPDIDPAWLEARRAEMGDDAYQREYGAQFGAGAGEFFDLKDIEWESGPAAPEDASGWVCGLDPAFHSDRFGVALVGEARWESDTLLLGRVDAIEPQGVAKSFEQRRAREDATLAEVWAVIEPYAAQGLKIVTDQHQASAVESFFGRKGITVEVVNLTGPVQTQAFTALRARLVDGSLRAWRHPGLYEDLRRVRVARRSEAVELPRYAGGHIDCGSALALAVRDCEGMGGIKAFAIKSFVPGQGSPGEDEAEGDVDRGGGSDGWSNPIDSWRDDGW
ncbi:MAG: terminase family protein [Solirubrobacteraceae bacterium]